MHFLLSAIAIAGKAGKSEFTNEFVRRQHVQEMQKKIETIHDNNIESMGFDKIRSKIELITNDGTKHTRWADENYRGGPLNPLSDSELEDKFHDASLGQFSDDQKSDLFSIDQVCKFVKF